MLSPAPLPSVSIHASAREATKDLVCGSARLGVSIHASAREATSAPVWSAAAVNRFDPRLREGGDERHRVKATRHPVFRSTPPRGRRRPRFQRCARDSRFDPRLREGGDRVASAGPSRHGVVSIHASAREATLLHAVSQPPKRVSIHASAREATGRAAPRALRL